MKYKALATAAVAGAISVTALVTGVGTASAQSTDLTGFCYSNSTRDSQFRYAVFGTASPVVGGQPGGPFSQVGYDVVLTSAFQFRNADGTYRRAGADVNSTTFIRDFAPNTVCLSVDSSYGFAAGNFIPR